MKENEQKGKKLKSLYVQFAVLIIVFILSYQATIYYMARTSQPIAFNHKQHVILNDEETRKNCLDCHVPGYDEPDTAEEGDSIPVLYSKFLDKWRQEIRDVYLKEKRIIKEPAMVIPNVGLCATCHSNDDYEKAEKKTKPLKQISDYSDENRRIPWKRNYRLADHAIYSHARHLAFGEIDCIDCHGDVANMVDPVTRPHADTVDMFNGCLECHRTKNLRKISSDCLSCHK